jgi:hypothetical protein
MYIRCWCICVQYVRYLLLYESYASRVIGKVAVYKEILWVNHEWTNFILFYIVTHQMERPH